MATLVCRPGDPQALKAAAAAGLSGAALAVVAVDDVGSWKKLLSDPSSPFGYSQLFLVLPDGTAVFEANAMARCLGARRMHAARWACLVAATTFLHAAHSLGRGPMQPKATPQGEPATPCTPERVTPAPTRQRTFSQQLQEG